MIAVDWGTTHLRLYRMGADGTLSERRRSDQGTLATGGRFGAILAAEMAGWDDSHVLLCGMAGARGGWHEMPYLDCPAGLPDLARHMQRIHPPGFEHRELWFVPGLRDTSETVPDVMRGEETQLAALLDVLPGGVHQVCLPGTHSKWVTIRDGRVQRIRTAMTGELYALLRKHSILGALMSHDDSRFDAYAFEAGLRRSAEPGGLLHHLFGVRTAGLSGQFAEAALPSYLSGLLVGHELHECGLAADRPRPAQVHLIGSERLLGVYARALTTLEIGVQRHPEDLAARGLHLLWTRRMQAAGQRAPAPPA
ncbi:2-dehydro-3-deoxygalactonokinase [Luteimonas viscosa]|uniref:2-dehydro-3-deoxygalactonokinase n=1 Tax=Luteimonas viscosa TaxID=1132694 RepID=A0A5D4XQN0_9GAMM|nr:2-dehydro-3-deoxygalactonokinase [Luteimonas viscosa]TYT26869.1 2-dehydro-3-deoxygalactonokinase [Luteimonas viscosa]